MQRWEYKVLHGAGAEDSLAQLGREGWELVAVTPGGSQQEVRWNDSIRKEQWTRVSWDTTFYLKRLMPPGLVD
jgi:hypothetical protein